MVFNRQIGLNFISSTFPLKIKASLRIAFSGFSIRSGEICFTILMASVVLTLVSSFSMTISSSSSLNGTTAS